MGRFPNSDPEFDEYINTAITYLAANEVRLEVDPADNVDLNTLLGSWNIDFPKTQDPAQSTEALVKDKDDLKKEIIDTLRRVYGDIPQSLLTNTDRSTLRLHKRDDENTETPVMDHSPSATVKKQSHRSMTLTIADPENPMSRALPKGQKVLLKRIMTVATIVDETEHFTEVDLVTRTTFLLTFEEEDVRKNCQLSVCYVNPRGIKGPWSPVYSFLVT